MLSPNPSQDPLDLETVSPFHLLTVGDNILPEEIDVLTAQIWPQSNHAELDLLELTSGAYPTESWHLTPRATVKLGLFLYLGFAYITSVPVLRGKPVPQELWGRNPLWDVFRKGGSEGLEPRILNGIRHTARRLARVLWSSVGPIIVPDPDLAVEMRVLSEVWLELAVCLQISQQTFLRARLELGNAPDGDISSGRNRRLTIAAAYATHGPDELRVHAQEGVNLDEHAWLHAGAEASDEAAMSMPPVLGVYAISVDITPVSTVHATVSEEIAIPPALGHWEDGLTSYDLRWIAPDMALTGMNKPCRAYHLDRLKIAETIKNLAKPLAVATNRVVVGADKLVVSF